jgi:hypothetical protein
MKLAIMQPYFLPYIGYFQLIDSVDLFVIYDDVNYIKKGWINRNNILLGNKPHLFSLPLQSASQNKYINETQLDANPAWKPNLLKTIQQAYRKAPFFDTVFPLLEAIVGYEEQNLARFCAHSLQKTSNYLQLATRFVNSSEIQKDEFLKGQDKILEIGKKLHATTYINAIGGMELYDSEAFSNAGIALHFLKTNPITYRQFKAEFIPWLSIIDVLMFNDIAQTKALLQQKELI